MMVTEEESCLNCGWYGVPVATEDIGSGPEWECPSCGQWQHIAKILDGVDPGAGTESPISNEHGEAAEPEESEAEGVEETEAATIPSVSDPSVSERRERVQVGPNFFLHEFDCKDGTPCPSSAIPAIRRLVEQVLQPLRNRYGACTVISGYRTERHNKNVGGASNSRHLPKHYDHSPAADVRLATGTVDQWAETAESVLGGRGGLGKYRTTIHVDLRDVRARW
jgi:hypothetical protein